MIDSGLESFRPASDAPPPAADGFWDTAVRGDNEAWRYARRLAAAAAAEQRDRAPRCADCKAARAVKEEIATPPPAPPRRLAHAVGRALLLVAAAAVGVTCGMLADGSGGLPLDLRSWGRLLAQVSPAAAATPPALLAWAAPAAAEASLAPTVTLAVPRSGASVPPVRASDWFATELVDGVTLAATMRELPAAAARRDPTRAPAPTASERPAAPHRVQLAMLRNQRYVEPVWVDFTTRLGPLTHGLERHVLPITTKRGLRHLVQAGPFADAGAARAMCRRYRAAGGDCFVVPPA
jgi:SPOR domain